MELNLTWAVITALIVVAVILTRGWRLGAWVAGSWLLMLLVGAALAARADVALGVPAFVFWSLGAVGLLIGLLGAARR